MNLKVYTKRKYDNRDIIEAGVGKSIVIDSATTFYMQLEAACSEDILIAQKYDILRNVFGQVINQSIMDCKIALVGLFSKVDYCIKENHIPDDIATLIHDTRKFLYAYANRREELIEEKLIEGFPYNLKSTTLLVYYLCNQEPIPETLKTYLPTTDKKTSWGKFSDKVLRVSVERWDDDYIWATEAENGSTLQVCYNNTNIYLTRNGKEDWKYLKTTIWEGAVLNLVRLRMDESGEIALPELIILEPDYLINITTIASCFETYAESPFVNLVNKIKPSPNTIHIHLGNLASQLLDDTVHRKQVSFEDAFNDFVSRNALALISCPDFISKVGEFKNDGRIQKRNIEKIIGQDLPASIGHYDRQSVLLEPSFFSSTLGIQGRFDFLEEEDDRVIIIEQKSGKSEFVKGANPTDPLRPKEQHTVQALLYRALYQYELSYNNALNITNMLLYSKYEKGLMQIPPMPSLLLRAIRIRNLIAWSEYLYAKEGMEVLITLTPEKLNQKGSSGKLWQEYTEPQLQGLLAPIHNASALERAYYLRFLRFIENELLLAKVGNNLKENSGFASIWHDTLEEKKLAGNIYDKLVIAEYGLDGQSVTSIQLRFLEPQSSDSSNFRTGDIVILYPYKDGEVPDACAQLVNRASIVDIKEDGIELRLRNPQTDRKVFENHPTGTMWVIEHDLFESSTGSLFSAMHSFLSAPKRRRDLILSQRIPETDISRKIKGDYDTFNELVVRAKQAKDLFLIIGPPGTGKTSHGLVNLLKEELLEDGSNILLLSYTNRAVDEICSKLVEIKNNDTSFDFIRIGSDLSCASEYRKYLLSTRCATAQSGNEVNKAIISCRVFCGTTAALNSNMSLFTLKHFNLAIVDESSQILEPHLIGLLSAVNNGKEAIEKFVLIGDHKQLPAVVQQPPEESMVTEPELNDINLKDCRISLFERLLKQFKTDDGYEERFVYMLTKQGRMHKDIAEFPNYAFYGNKLDIVPLDHQTLPTRMAGSENGIINLLTSRRIVFIASDAPLLSPSVKTNSVEANMIAATVRQIFELTKDEFDEGKTVGVIVPYRNQVSTVRNAIDKLGIPVLHNITIDTVERYQGSQRDYIIYGFTIQQPYQLNFLTNNVFEEDGMVIDRKLNVAMTRARLNLVMIGNPSLLNENFTFYKLMEFVRCKGGYFSISAEDYCKGNFYVPEVVDAKQYDMSDNVFEMSDELHQAFSIHITEPIKNDSRTTFPNTILGNTMDANMSLINYGRINFSNQLSLYSDDFKDTFAISPEDQVRLYCYYIMRMHYCSAKGLYSSYSKWLMSHIKDVNGRVQMIDIGCGPATCGLAFYELFKAESQLFYTGVDVSIEMKKMAKLMLEDVCGNNVDKRFICSFQELTDAHWSSISEVPNLVVFNMSYFFSNVDSNFTEKLATRIIDVMGKNPLNKYVFMIQHSDHDNRIRSFSVFRKLLRNHVEIIKSEKSQFKYQLGGIPRIIPFCYEIWISS